ncbi:MAG: D-aminoacyl-tRNA deacylase [Waddliaceae bacterium]
MKLLIQRVSKASVVSDNQETGRIEKGILVFFGVHKEDTEEKIAPLVKKLAHLRIFEDASGKLNLDVQEINGGILVVSQFTLYGNCLRGRRPDFLEAAEPRLAKDLYMKFISELKRLHPKVETGRFGAHMDVSLVNDGPVTFILEK